MKRITSSSLILSLLIHLKSILTAYNVTLTTCHMPVIKPFKVIVKFEPCHCVSYLRVILPCPASSSYFSLSLSLSLSLSWFRSLDEPTYLNSGQKKIHSYIVWVSCTSTFIIIAFFYINLSVWNCTITVLKKSNCVIRKIEDQTWNHFFFLNWIVCNDGLTNYYHFKTEIIPVSDII